MKIQKIVLAGILLGGLCAMGILVPVRAREAKQLGVPWEKISARMTSQYGADWDSKMCATYTTNRTEFRAMKRFLMAIN